MTFNSKVGAKLNAILSLAHCQGVASSISLGVLVENEDPQYFYCGGTQRANTGQTIYDLASLTKILCTTIAVIDAICDGKIALDDCPFLEWPNTTLRSLLEHKSGLPAHRRFYLEQELSNKIFSLNREKIIREILNIKMVSATSQRVYSDLGFIALSVWLEKIFQKPLAEIFLNIFKRYGLLEEFRFYPSGKIVPANEKGLIAPTGFCSLRKEWLTGQVHDTNCFFLGGVSGHAGLFGTIAGVAKMGQLLLSCVQEKNYSCFNSAVAYFARYGLSFDKPSPNGTTRYFSPHAFGHFGYTGTSLWIDPKAFGKGVVIALLTNRVFCSEKPQGIFALRRDIFRAIMSL